MKCRITQIRTSLFIHPDSWDASRQKIKGSSDLAKELNSQLQTHKLRALKAYDDLMKQDSVFSSKGIIEKYNSKQIEVKGIMEALEYYNIDKEAEIGIEALC